MSGTAIHVLWCHHRYGIRQQFGIRLCSERGCCTHKRALISWQNGDPGFPSRGPTTKMTSEIHELLREASVISRRHGLRRPIADVLTYTLQLDGSEAAKRDDQSSHALSGLSGARDVLVSRRVCGLLHAVVLLRQRVCRHDLPGTRLGLTQRAAPPRRL